MTSEEFKDYKDRVDMYEMFDKKRKNLISEKGYIENGILSITAAYQHEINFYLDKEIENKIIKAIIGVYEDEIQRIDKALKGI